MHNRAEPQSSDGVTTPGFRDDSKTESGASSQFATSASHQKKLRLFLVIAVGVLLIVTVTSTISTRKANRNLGEIQRKLLLADANTLLVIQQSHQMFEVLMERYSEDGNLTEPDRIFLKTWLQFDEKFLIQNITNRSLRYERSTIQRRMGKILSLMGDDEQAAEYYQHAIVLLRDLYRENPTVISYLAETFFAYDRLGQLMEATEHDMEAISAYQHAIRLMENARIQSVPIDDQRLADLYQKLAALGVRIHRSF